MACGCRVGEGVWAHDGAEALGGGSRRPHGPGRRFVSREQREAIGELKTAPPVCLSAGCHGAGQGPLFWKEPGKICVALGATQPLSPPLSSATENTYMMGVAAHLGDSTYRNGRGPTGVQSPGGQSGHGDSFHCQPTRLSESP